MITMTNKNNKTQSGTNVQHVKQQNAQAAGKYGTEFASETSTQHVKQANAQAEAGKNQKSGKYQG